jgi:shikimate kinase
MWGFIPCNQRCSGLSHFAIHAFIAEFTPLRKILRAEWRCCADFPSDAGNAGLDTQQRWPLLGREGFRKKVTFGMRLKKSVVLVGMMGAGKTAVGTQLARILSVPFIDSDDAIVAAANRSIAEIFERDGEPFFRQKESQVIGRLLEGPPCVLSTGGGAFMSPLNRQMMAAQGVSVWLCADLDLLWQRVRHKTTRPLLRTSNPRATLKEIYDLRVPVYALADLKVDAAPELSIDEMANRVREALLTRPDVLEG